MVGYGHPLDDILCLVGKAIRSCPPQGARREKARGSDSLALNKE